MRWWQRRFILRAFALDLDHHDAEFVEAVAKMAHNKAVRNLLDTWKVIRQPSGPKAEVKRGL